MRGSKWGWLFTLPALGVLAFLTIFPIIYNFYLSLHETKISYMRIEYLWKGLENFNKIFSDALFWRALLNTLYFMGVATAAEVLLGLGFALLFKAKIAGKEKIVPALLLPMMLPTIVVTAFWKTLLHPDFGAINSILEMIGLPKVNWLGDPAVAMNSIILIDVWQWTPFVFIFLYASLQTIPRELEEAAMVDGASQAQIIRSIIIPLLRPYILIVVLLRLIDTFRLFDKVYALTGGGPGTATESLTLIVYRYAFGYHMFGYAAALSLLMLGIISVIIAIYIAYTRGGGVL